jgi:hypothetical protein
MGAAVYREIVSSASLSAAPPSIILGAVLGLEESPRDGGVDGRLRHLEREQAQAFATSLAKTTHPQRARPCWTRLCDVVVGDCHGTSPAFSKFESYQAALSSL